MPIEFDRVKNNHYFNKFYGDDAVARSGHSTAPYVLGWNNRFGPPAANERINSDHYNVSANPGLAINSGLLHRTGGGSNFLNDYMYAPQYGPVNNTYKITISGIQNDTSPGNCIDCDRLNGVFYVDALVQSPSRPAPALGASTSEGYVFWNSIINQTAQHDLHTLWQNGVSRNKQSPCGNVFESGGYHYNPFYGELFQGGTADYRDRYNDINLTLTQYPFNNNAIANTGVNVIMSVFFSDNYSLIHNVFPFFEVKYGVAFNKDFGNININDRLQANNRPFMLEGQHILLPTTGVIDAQSTTDTSYKISFNNDPDNNCNYSSAICTVEPYKESTWDYRQVKTPFVRPYGFNAFDSYVATYCSGKPTEHFIPSSFQISLTGVVNNFTNPLCIDCGTFYEVPITLYKNSSTTTINNGTTIRYEWLSRHSSSYISKYNICEYSCYDYNTNAVYDSNFTSAPVLDNWQRARDLPAQAYCHNRVILDIISSGIALAGSGYSVRAELSYFNGYSAGGLQGPKFTKILCDSFSNCFTNISGYSANLGAMNCLSNTLYQGNWVVDSGIRFDYSSGNQYGAAVSGILMNTSAAHLCNFTNAVPVVTPNTYLNNQRQKTDRETPCLFNDLKKTPQTLAVNYACSEGEVTYYYNSPLKTCTFDGAPGVPTYLGINDALIYADTYFKLRFSGAASISGGTLPAGKVYRNHNFVNGAYANVNGNILIGPSIGSTTNNKVDFSTANWTGAASGHYYRELTTFGFPDHLIDFTVTATLTDFITIDYP